MILPRGVDRVKGYVKHCRVGNAHHLGFELLGLTHLDIFAG